MGQLPPQVPGEAVWIPSDPVPDDSDPIPSDSAAVDSGWWDDAFWQLLFSALDLRPGKIAHFLVRPPSPHPAVNSCC